MPIGYEDDMRDPTPPDPIPQEETPFPGQDLKFDPTKQYFWNGSEWEEMKKGGGRFRDGCYISGNGEKVCWDPDHGKDPNAETKKCTDDEDLVNGECVPKCSPTQRRANKGKMKGECVDRPPCKPASDGTPRIRNKETGKCVPDTNETTGRTLITRGMSILTT